MFNTIFGLPAHPLIVHATVVVVPAPALVVAASAVALVPITTASGGELEKHLPHNALIERYTQLADGLLLPVLILAVAALAVTWI